MLFKIILYFLPLFAILTNVNYYQVKNLPPNPKVLFFYSLLMIPAFFIANYGINYIFNISYREINNIWHVNIYLWIANFLNVAFFSFVWFQELPTLKTLAAAILVIIAILLIR
jgi:hypothetical protein